MMMMTGEPSPAQISTVSESLMQILSPLLYQTQHLLYLLPFDNLYQSILYVNSNVVSSMISPSFLPSRMIQDGTNGIEAQLLKPEHMTLHKYMSIH